MMAAYHLVIAIVILAVAAVKAVDWDVVTPLDDYVNRLDPTYSYYELETFDHEDYTIHTLNVTSQQWMDETFSEDSLWWHYLSIFIPKNPRITDAAYLAIGNGYHTNDPPVPDTGVMARVGNFCSNTGAVTAYLSTVPFQPITFANTSIRRVEDFIIGYTWAMYIEDPEEPNPDIIVLLPMAKAAKKALDTMHDFVQEHTPSINLTKFMPAGFSKRGWTTWLLGCVDRRVFAMAPTVFDLLSMQPNLEHHYRALGGWSWAFAPYWLEGVARYLYHPRVLQMATFIDPLEFNERLTMPKLIINAAGDEFFPPDGAHYFYKELTGPKFLQLWENDSHGLGNHQDQRDRNLEAFFLRSYRGEQFPSISWTRSEDDESGTITVTSDPVPLAIKAWWADTTNETCEEERNNTCRRDFRITTLRGPSGIWWSDDKPVDDLGSGMYQIHFEKRTDFGYRGFFVEMIYPGPDDYEMRFTTEINIIPDTFPYPKCETEDECQGRLV